MLNEILKNPELYKTDIIKKPGPVDDQEPKDKRRQGKKNKKGGRRVDEATALALEEAKLEEQKEELDAQQKKRVEQMVKSGGEVNILDATKIDLTSAEIGKHQTRDYIFLLMISYFVTTSDPLR